MAGSMAAHRNAARPDATADLPRGVPFLRRAGVGPGRHGPRRRPGRLPRTGWTPDWAPRPLLGMSHGAAGIAWALAELASATGDHRFQRGAQGALDFEAGHFDRVAGNWPTTGRPSVWRRGPTRRPRWRGATVPPGGGLARLMLRGHGLDEAALKADVAVGTTPREGFGVFHCLCHGDLGNAEFLALAGRAYGVPAWRSDALRRAKAVLLEEAEGGWRCGNRGRAETPGLMSRPGRDRVRPPAPGGPGIGAFGAFAARAGVPGLIRGARRPRARCRPPG